MMTKDLLPAILITIVILIFMMVVYEPGYAAHNAQSASFLAPVTGF